MQYSMFREQVNILPFQGEAFFYPEFFTSPGSDGYFQTLLNEINWKQEPVKIFGREVMQPRLTAWYGDTGKTYTYTGITMHPYPWTNTLLKIKEKIEPVAGVRFTSALLNQYRDGKDSMGWHRDNEKELGLEPVIGSVSFGASRKFQFRNYKEKSIIRSIDLTHGSLLIMRGKSQQHWQHRLPKVSDDIGPRVNITFRVIG